MSPAQLCLHSMTQQNWPQVGPRKKHLDHLELFAFLSGENAATGWNHCVGWILPSGQRLTCAQPEENTTSFVQHTAIQLLLLCLQYMHYLY